MDTTPETRTPGADVIPLAIYVRITDDDKDEQGELTREGVDRQEADCRELADSISATLGVTFLLTVYDDNNITAADEFVTRPDFEQLLKDLESGVQNGVLFYRAERVARLDYDAARVTRIFRKNPKYIGRSVTGGVDLSTDEGRAMFMMQAVMGGWEVATTKVRVARQNRGAAEKGRNHGGKRAFGWEADRSTLRDAEAKLIADAVRDVARGKTIGTVRREWIAAGVTATAEGKGPLRDHTVLTRLINPRICGYRAYISKAERRDLTNLWPPDHVLYVDGKPVIGDWTPIVKPAEWAACVAALEERRTHRRDHEYSRLHAKYLLSGIARCGICGARMYGKLQKGDTIHRYLCITREGGCGRMKRAGPILDDYVEGLFLKAVLDDIGDAEPDDIDDTMYDARLAELHAEKMDVMARRRPEHPNRISTAIAMDLIADLETEEADLTYKARKLMAAKLKRQNETPDLLAEWGSYTVDMKRDRLRRDIRAVVVNKTVKGGRFDPACIEIAWVT